MLGNEKTTHLVANRVPCNIRTKIVSVWYGDNPHETRVRLGARRFLKHVLRCPVDELGPLFLRAYTSIVEVRLEFRDVIGAGLSSGGTRDTVAAGPESFISGATTLVLGG